MRYINSIDTRRAAVSNVGGYEVVGVEWLGNFYQVEVVGRALPRCFESASGDDV